MALVVEAYLGRDLRHAQAGPGQRRAGPLQPQPHQPGMRRQPEGMREAAQKLEAAQAAQRRQVFQADLLAQALLAVVQHTAAVLGRQAALDRARRRRAAAREQRGHDGQRRFIARHRRGGRVGHPGAMQRHQPLRQSRILDQRGQESLLARAARHFAQKAAHQLRRDAKGLERMGKAIVGNARAVMDFTRRHQGDGARPQ